MKNICWIQHASEWPLFDKVAKKLEDMGCESIFICKTRPVYEHYKKAGFKTYFISKIFNDGVRITDEEIQSYDLKYGPPGFGEIGVSDCDKNSIPYAQFAIGPGDDYCTLDNVKENHMWTELLDLVKSGPRRLDNDELTFVKSFVSARTKSIESKMSLRFIPESLYKSVKDLIGLYIRDNRQTYAEDPVKVGSIRFSRGKLLKKMPKL